MTNAFPEQYHGFIYITFFPNGKVYIGQTILRLETCYYGSGKKVSLAIKKYSRRPLTRQVLKFVDNQKQLDIWERIYIKKYKSTLDHIGYNLDNGGSGAGRVSELTKEKIRLTKIGKPMSQNARDSMSRAQLNRFQSPDECKSQARVFSDETKQKMRLAKLGKKLSEEHKMKIAIKITSRKINS